MAKLLNIFIFLFHSFPVLAQPSEKKTTPEQYIANFKEDAIREMKQYNIPASITLAQGMLESSNGNSDLAVYANNHFGIKCHSTWNGPTFIKDDDKKDECFRKYASALDSYNDHSQFLKSGSRYAFLFELKPTDYKGWAKGLKEAGYATDPKYPKRLMDLIERYKLYEYDAEGSINNKKRRDDTPASSKSIQTREILRYHFIKYVIIKPGDTFTKIAQETDKDLWQLYKYNNMKPEEVLTPGQRLYLQPKRRKAIEEFHVVKNGETMKSISQEYGIRLSSLYKKNNMKQGEEPVVGQQLYMRKRKK